MEKATDKQIKFGRTLGLDLSESSKQEASAAIDTAVEGKDKFKKELKVPETESVEDQKWKPKKSFDNSSYYVAYAKDLCIAMLNVQAESFRMGCVKFDELGEVGKLMGEAIQCIEFAKKKFS